VIEIGKDGVDRWAWMLLATDGRMIESGDALADCEGAVEQGAMAWARARNRGEPGCPIRPQFHFNASLIVEA
jgi:hypothetical protein